MSSSAMKSTSPAAHLPASKAPSLPMASASNSSAGTTTITTTTIATPQKPIAAFPDLDRFSLSATTLCSTIQRLRAENRMDTSCAARLLSAYSMINFNFQADTTMGVFHYLANVMKSLPLPGPFLDPNFSPLQDSSCIGLKHHNFNLDLLPLHIRQVIIYNK